MLVHQNHADGGENGSIMAGMFVSLCLASKKPSQWEFFVPAGTDLAVKLLTTLNVIQRPKRRWMVDVDVDGGGGGRLTIVHGIRGAGVLGLEEGGRGYCT
jgi:hypothetical protein